MNMSEQKQMIKCDAGSAVLTSVEDMFRLATMFAQSGLCPRGLDTPQKVVVALQAGAELGFKPWQSLQSLHIVNGRVGLEGSALCALIRRAKVTEYLVIEYSGKEFDDDFKAVVVSKRKGDTVDSTTEFSVADAKRAGLWGGKDNWSKYPKDMLTWRAVARHSRLYYPDVTQGFYTLDELSGVESEASAPAVEQAGKGVDGLAETLAQTKQVASEEVMDDFEVAPTVCAKHDVALKKDNGGRLFCSECIKASAPETPQEAEQPAPAPETPDDKSVEQEAEEAVSAPKKYLCQSKGCGIEFDTPKGNKKKLCPKCLSEKVTQVAPV